MTFRTLDIGGDKVLPYLRIGSGRKSGDGLAGGAARVWTGPRFAAGRSFGHCCARAPAANLKLMFPMVTETGEFENARAILERDKIHLKKHGYDRAERAFELGAMIEVPTLLFELDELFRIVDFASVGSNDLFHFMTATDRGNPRVADRYDPLSAPFLRVLKIIVDRAALQNKPVTICGEIAGRPLEAMALIALGYRTLSMSPAAIGPVKAMLLKLNAAQLRTRLLPRMEAGRWDGDLRLFLKSYAEDHGIPV